MPPKIFKNMNFLDFRIFGGDVYRAHGRYSGSSAMPLAEVIHEIRLKNEKWKISENVYFFDEKYFSNDFEKNINFEKVTFSKNVKNQKCWLFRKKLTFWNFRFFKIFRKIFFIEFFLNIRKFSVFIFVSYLMYNLS